MNKEYDLNLAEENNYSIITSDELQDMTSFTEYSSFVVTSSDIASPKNTNNQNNNQYADYSKPKLQPSVNNLPDNMYGPYGSSGGNATTPESFRQYMDQLTAYLIKNDPISLQYLIENINKGKNGELDLNETGRMTPLLYPEIHAIARLDFPGLLYQLIPNSLNNSGGIITISDEIYPKYYDFRFDDYPGPLTIEKTTEEQIFYYLKDQVSVEFQDSLPTDLDSERLLINYLELLIKENGKPRMSNIVRLLNDGMETKTADFKKDYKSYDSISRNSFSRASSRATSRASSRAVSPENKEIIDNDLPQNPIDTPRGPGSVTSVMRRAMHNVTQDQKSSQNMDKFREYIWSGRFEEAVNFAMRVGIWDHAFALALRMNNSVLVNEILVRFSRRAIHGNDPLFTMHELMAARQPRFVAINRGLSYLEMNDWRYHLSMILAVRKFRPDESRQAIESMGDKLILLRCFFAAHLCFLLAETPFGVDKTVHKYRRKYDLIGWHSSTSNIPAQKSTHDYCHKLFSGLKYWQSAPEQYIKLTEIYEYVLKLRNDNSHKSLSVHLLPYKYLMAHSLLAKHHTRNAYEYCRNIGEILGYRDIDWLQSESVNFNIISNIRSLSYKLHSLLTTEEDYDDDMNGTDNTWLENIDNVYCLFSNKCKVWNPKSTKPDFFSEQITDKISDKSESIGALCSPIRREFGGQSTIGHSYVQEVNNPNYSRQQPQVQEYHEEVNRQFVPDHKHIHIDSNHDKKYYPKAHGNASSNENPALNFQSQQIPSKISQKSGPITSSVGPLSYQNMAQYSAPQESLPREPASQNVVQHTSMRYPFGVNNFTDIPPPSELPAEMIMTSPPRRFDIKNTSSTNVDSTRDRQHLSDKYDNRNLTHPNNDYSQNNIPNSSFGQQNFQMPLMTQGPPDPNYGMDNRSQFPALPPKNSGYNFLNANNEPQYQYPNSDPVNQDINQAQAMMFIPSNNADLRGSNETVDCFAIMPGYNRSRSQSNGSVGSVDSQMKSVSRHSISRSRNSSESKDPKLAVGGHVSNRPLESTKEEMEHQKQDKTKNETNTNTEKKTSWNPLGWFSSKAKDIHLPDDSEKSWEYDATRNRWVNKTDSQEEKPPTPPPKMPAAAPQMPYGFMSQPTPYQGLASQNTLSKYRQASPNVRPSLNIASPVLPSYRGPAQMPINQGLSQYSNHEYNDNRPFSTDDDHQYNNSSQLSYHNTNYQMDSNSQYDSNPYQNSYPR